MSFSVSGALTFVAVIVPRGNQPVQEELFGTALVLLTVGLVLLGFLLRRAGLPWSGVAVLWVAAAAALAAVVGAVFESRLGPFLTDLMWRGGQFVFILATLITSLVVLSSEVITTWLFLPVVTLAVGLFMGDERGAAVLGLGAIGVAVVIARGRISQERSVETG
ncbi:hypothetical protein EV652_10677 [Kribbella steppae]|uniref:Uncharacterized protein n=1 Tax=Kribbella steppae TaxID=2512223 RepID=A0A4R2HJZ3_9ACTN|nr:hypothetical protein [Kribbella steppae]TCO28095.1 hypothetical protein EV652_10677 [Kribbella steppae]